MDKIEMRQRRGVIKGRTRGKLDQICGKLIEFGILGLIVLSPLPAASVYDWSILVIQITVLIMMVAYFLMRNKPETNEFLSLSMKWSRVFFIGLFILLFIQIIPLPKFLVKIFSPSAFSFRQQYLTDFSEMTFMSFSLIPNHSLREGLELLTYFFIGFLILRTVTRRAQINRIFSVLIAVGVFEAFYGMFELYNKNPRILFYKKVHYLDTVTGTFVNRNHLSGYLEMVIPLAIGLIIAKGNLFSTERLKWREKILRISEKGFSTNLLMSIAIIIMSLGIIFSKSRSGIFLLVFSFILFFGLAVLYFRRTEDQKKWISTFLAIIFIFIVIFSLYIGLSNTLERFSLDKLLLEKRPVFWENTLGLFKDFPIFGTGLGTFSSLYPDWDQDGNLVRVYHAHNDYLEYLSELGIMGFLFLLMGILFMIIKSFLVWRGRRRAEVKGLALGGIIALICMLIHSITDFNLHIPANMILFSVVLSLTAVIAHYRMNAVRLEDRQR